MRASALAGLALMAGSVTCLVSADVVATARAGAPEQAKTVPHVRQYALAISRGAQLELVQADPMDDVRTPRAIRSLACASVWRVTSVSVGTSCVAITR